MNLTNAQLQDILKRPGIAAANPDLGAVVPCERKQDPRPALVKDASAKSSVRSGVAVRVTLIACRRKRLDGDNLQGAFKHLRDCIAARLGIDDGSEAIEWEYGQVLSESVGTIVRISWA